MADTTFTALSAVRVASLCPTRARRRGEGRALHLIEVNALTGAIGKFREREALRPTPPDGQRGFRVRRGVRPRGHPGDCPYGATPKILTAS